MGVPGEPSDWTRAGYADTTSTAFAELHHGVAPILVIPDNNGNLTSDSECSNSAFGNSETYLIKDVPTYMQAEFKAAIGKHAMAVAGLSAGGTCATILALATRRPSRPSRPTRAMPRPPIENDDAQQTITNSTEGRRPTTRRTIPVNLLTGHRYPGSAGWFTAGQSDPQPLAALHQLASLAKKDRDAGLRILTAGYHSFTFWAAAFRLSLPWLSWRLGLTPPRDRVRPTVAAGPLSGQRSAHPPPSSLEHAPWPERPRGAARKLPGRP